MHFYCSNGIDGNSGYYIIVAAENNKVFDTKLENGDIVPSGLVSKLSLIRDDKLTCVYKNIHITFSKISKHTALELKHKNNKLIDEILKTINS